MRKEILFEIIIFSFLVLLFPVVVSAANIDLPYYRSFESDPVDLDFDDGNCKGLDVPHPGITDYCTIKVRDDYPARYGDQYLEMRCEYKSVSTREKTMRAGNMTFEGFRDGNSCHEMRTNDNTEYWFGWSNYIPRDYMDELFKHAVFQVGTDSPPSVTSTIQYGAGPDGAPVATDSTWTIWNRSDDGHDSNTFGDWHNEKGKWVDWVVHVVWHDNDHTNAKWEVYQNGVIQHNRNGLENVVENGKPILSFCNYNWAYSDDLDAKANISHWDVPHHRATYMDEFRFYEQIGGSGEYGYCDACPPIVAEQPAISYPSSNDSMIPTNYTLAYGGYIENRSDPQNCFSYSTTHIQIDENGGDWSSLAYESTSASETLKEITGLAASTQYQVRVRHKSKRLGRGGTYLGPWSSVVKFRTGTTFPGISTPGDFKVLP